MSKPNFSYTDWVDTRNSYETTAFKIGSYYLPPWLPLDVWRSIKDFTQIDWSHLNHIPERVLITTAANLRSIKGLPEGIKSLEISGDFALVDKIKRGDLPKSLEKIKIDGFRHLTSINFSGCSNLKFVEIAVGSLIKVIWGSVQVQELILDFVDMSKIRVPKSVIIVALGNVSGNIQDFQCKHMFALRLFSLNDMKNLDFLSGVLTIRHLEIHGCSFLKTLRGIPCIHGMCNLGVYKDIPEEEIEIINELRAKIGFQRNFKSRTEFFKAATRIIPSAAKLFDIKYINPRYHHLIFASDFSLI